jgi:hypothetical protein
MISPRQRALAGAVLFAAHAGACDDRPARFADRPPATRMPDDLPSELPRRRAAVAELREAEAYVRRGVVDALDPRRAAEAVDVNALDEVVTSSWFVARAVEDPRDGYARVGEPRPPLTPVAGRSVSEVPGARRFVDARGLGWELFSDPPDRPGMRTAAAAITSRLWHALGYRTAEVHVVRGPDGGRAAALRWPVGEDLGPTPLAHRRGDDDNDRWAHRDRRSLRTFGIVAAWLGMTRVPAHAMRDAYVGAPGRGHVEHFLVDGSGALGAEDYIAAVERAQSGEPERPPLYLHVLTLGLWPARAPAPPRPPWPSVGLLARHVDLARFEPSPPLPPTERMTGADAYWLIKRIAALSPASIETAIAGGALEPGAGAWLSEVLLERRAGLVAWGMAQTTPLEIAHVGSARLVLADGAAARGLPAADRYRVQRFDGEGEPFGDEQDLGRSGPGVTVELPLPPGGYLVVRVLGMFGRRQAPRACEVHLRALAGGGWGLAGVRH